MIGKVSSQSDGTTLVASQSRIAAYYCIHDRFAVIMKAKSQEPRAKLATSGRHFGDKDISGRA